MPAVGSSNMPGPTSDWGKEIVTKVDALAGKVDVLSSEAVSGTVKVDGLLRDIGPLLSIAKNFWPMVSVAALIGAAIMALAWTAYTRLDDSIKELTKATINLQNTVSNQDKALVDLRLAIKELADSKQTKRLVKNANDESESIHCVFRKSNITGKSDTTITVSWKLVKHVPHDRVSQTTVTVVSSAIKVSVQLDSKLKADGTAVIVTITTGNSGAVEKQLDDEAGLSMDLAMVTKNGDF